MSQRPSKSNPPKAVPNKTLSASSSQTSPSPPRLDKNFAKVFFALVVLCSISVVWNHELPQNSYALWFSRITQCVFYINAGIAHFRVCFFFSSLFSFLFSFFLFIISSLLFILFYFYLHLHLEFLSEFLFGHHA